MMNLVAMKSEYWKSLPRKFCDICKCWFADNKASIDFHEKGKRHQENVQKRINELQKKGLKEYEEQKNLENEMQKIEQAALQAFKKDLQNNPDLAAQYHISMPSDKNDKTIEDTKAPKKELKEPQALKRELKKSRVIKNELKEESKDPYYCCEAAFTDNRNDIKKKKTIKKEEDKVEEEEEEEEGEEEEGEEKKAVMLVKNEFQKTLVSQETSKLWYEAVSDEGYTYYWNIETAASQWEPPEEGFVSLDEQNQQKVEDKSNNSPCKAENTSEEENEDGEEEDDTDKDTSDEIPSDAIGPQPKPDPYGQWIPVEHKVEKPVDLQLPEKVENALEASIPLSNDIRIKFKEKTVGHLSDTFSNEDSSFRKRKNIGDVKRNMRRRTREDD